MIILQKTVTLKIPALCQIRDLFPISTQFAYTHPPPHTQIFKSLG